MIGRLARLDPARRGLLAPAALTVVAARLALRLLPFGLVLRWAAGLASTVGRPCAPLDVRWAVDAVANRVPGTRCLARALAIQRLLGRRGIASELRLGVAEGRGAAPIGAHAWVLCNGEPLHPGDGAGYTPLA